MPSLVQVLLMAPGLLAVAQAQGVIIKAQGTSGSPASPGLQVDLTKADANIIRTSEIVSNVVNQCGRTLLNGNIDVGANTEDQLANKTVTSTTKGGKVAVTIRQGDANGAGPYTCDLDPTSNADGATGQLNLTTTETTSSTGDITLSVTMPTDLACVGASTGNVCTVRCFNKAAAGPFGGCFAVQQTDTTAAKNSPATIKTAQTLDGINAQILQNQKDLQAVVKANAAASLNQQGVFLVDALLNIDSTASATVPPGAVATGSGTKSSNNAKSSSKASSSAAKAAAAKAAAAKANAAKANAAKANAAKANAAKANAAKANAANTNANTAAKANSATNAKAAGTAQKGARSFIA